MMLIDPFQMWVTGLCESKKERKSDQADESQNQIGADVSTDVSAHENRPESTSSLASAGLNDTKDWKYRLELSLI